MAVFAALGYDEKIAMCVRPEQLFVISHQAWREINTHLGTDANTLQEHVNQLSQKHFGHNVIIGDCFCGGGSIPFYVARMGCDTYASDFNPIAGLLTLASLNICGAGEEKLVEIKVFQQEVYNAVDREMTKLGI
jgi:putative DNA methylase